MFAVALYWEWVWRDYSIPLEKDEFSAVKSALFRHSKGREAVKKQIARVYGRDDIKTLSEIIVPEAPAMYDVEAFLTLSRTNTQPAGIEYTYESSFQLDAKEYLVAITSNTLAYQLAMEEPSITEIINVRDELLTQENLSSILQETKLGAQGVDSQGRVFRNELELERVNDRRAATKLGKEDINANGLVYALYRADLPTKNEMRASSLRFYFSPPPIKFDETLHYIYWFSDRVIYVRSISIDLSGFLPTDGNVMRIRTNMARAFLQNFDERSQRKIKIDVNDWLVTGQGVIVSWSKNNN